MKMINIKTLVESIHLEMAKEHKKDNHNLIYLIYLRKGKNITKYTTMNHKTKNKKVNFLKKKQRNKQTVQMKNMKNSLTTITLNPMSNN